MKKIILLLFVSSFVLCYSCKKDKSSSVPTPFAFTSLMATDSLVNVNTVTHVIATASGDDLTYSWSSADLNGNVYGTIIGGGEDIQWSICHNDRFVVTCTVSDKYNNTATKTVNITSKL